MGKLFGASHRTAGGQVQGVTPAADQAYTATFMAAKGLYRATFMAVKGSLDPMVAPPPNNELRFSYLEAVALFCWPKSMTYPSTGQVDSSLVFESSSGSRQLLSRDFFFLRVKSRETNFGIFDRERREREEIFLGELTWDNEPLMKALSKLVNLNNPDLVLFVGEALVGNDVVD
ncbi:PREDICTED: signal recognition [Prunus dulcis]|uniref:PREDICTED: signal recognition n=1 Tax=Prunus dulcis TaxID=3755 RepID=A0A5E4GJY8_PRUDU|nr:PREDICTED: signal recognition [Prunus dulcis]